jgi:hypothetical protein
MTKKHLLIRLQIKIRPKGLHNFAFCMLIFDFLFQPLKRTSTKAYVRNYKLFLQNEPKFQKVKLNVNKVLTKDYDKMDTWSIGKNEPKTKPNEPNLSRRSLWRSRNKANFRGKKSSWGANDRTEQSPIQHNNVSNICRLTWDFIGSTMSELTF